ncbi:MAG TPA: TIGR00153 family protein [Phycisphaerae bacterium]|nr:TIGR00153 family protein [Phycisphaerales bacterium]HNO76641.1 TIGR00153 family protein [Phycisphaerae bacterium]
MSKFVDAFRHSPFQPLKVQLDAVMRCVSLVKPLFEAVREGKFDTLESITKDIFKTEHAADVIKDEIRQTIPKTFYLPVFRGDLLGHVKLQDDMADAAEDVAFLLTVKNLTLPAAISDLTMDYVDSILNVCNLAQGLNDPLEEAVHQGFPHDKVENVLALVAKVERAEWESDRKQYKLSKALFALENEVSCLDIMLWFKVFGELGQLANSAESLADRVRRMLTSR